MKQIKVDVAVLGGGPGGYVAAIRASQLGYKVALIEKEKIGGICLNWGCIPSKSLIYSASLLQKMKNAETFGITGFDPAQLKPDWTKLVAKLSKNVEKLTTGVKSLLKHNHVEIINGFGKVIDKHKIITDEQEIIYENLIIATGSCYNIPEYAKDNPKFHTPKTIYNIQTIPEKIVIIGLGVVGTECAFLFADLGSKVTVVEKKEKIMPYLDKDLGKFLKRQLRKKNVNLLIGQKAVNYEDDSLVISDKNNNTQKIKAPIYLLATRRQGNLNGLEYLLNNQLKTAGNYIKTDLQSRTTLANVYAAGDVNGRYMLAHVASKEGQVAAESIKGSANDLIYDLMPYNLYANPEFASVGLTEEQVKQRGFVYKVGKFPLTANSKAIIEGEDTGFIKIIYEIKYGEILGIHTVAANATDLISEAILAMQSEATIWEIANSVHPHPTLSEVVMEAAYKGLEKPLHTL